MKEGMQVPSKRMNAGMKEGVQGGREECRFLEMYSMQKECRNKRRIKLPGGQMKAVEMQE